MTLLTKIAIGGVLLYLVSALALFFLQRRLVFSPDTTRVQPVNFELPKVSEVKLRSFNGHTLYCWYGPAATGKPTLLFLHGNGGNVAYRAEKFKKLMAEGYGVYMLGYRGFGGSEGAPSEVGLVRDSQVAYEYLRDQYKLQSEEIVIYGESIGTSVAVQLAAKVKAAALVLEAPMYSVLSIAQARYPYVPVRPFLRDKFETNLYIKDVTAPLLVVHGDKDEVIPLASGQALYELAPEPKRFEVINGAGHNDIYDYAVVPVIDEFLTEFVGEAVHSD
ncbi:MAG: alpha/beta hydrolase [Rhodomicrobium sp.]|nr:MAG: alpha/beta hydrolase [Rhodomicrobium sp.]